MNAQNKLACPACGLTAAEPLLSYDSFPAILFPIESEKKDSVRTSPLASAACAECGHVFLTHIDLDFNNSLYRDYYYLYPYKQLESMQGPYRDPFAKVADIFLKGGATLLEVGCESVEQIQPFLDRGYACTAINPGALPDERVRFIDGFYGSTELAESFDVVVSRFNLEHIVDLEAFFTALRKNLNPGGVAIVQVPNMEYFLGSGMLNVFAHEHPQYFCRASLLALVRRHGYDVRHISEPDSPSLICVFGSAERTYEPRGLLAGTSTALAALRRVITEASGEVVLYGAGLSLTGLLYASKLEPGLLEKVRVVDDNPILHGRYMPNTPLSVSNPADLRLSESATVVLTLSEQYHGRVLAKLKQAGAKCRIVAITSKGLVNVDD